MILKKASVFLLLLLLPAFVFAATLKGLVVDKDNALVADAALHFDCALLPKNIPATTDSFGSFRIEEFPLGDCDVFAQSNGYVGYTSVRVDEDDFERIIIHLDKKIAKEEYSFLFLIPMSIGVLFFLFIIILLLLWLFKKRKQKMNNMTTEEFLVQQKAFQENVTRLQTIAVTFSKAEKAVVDYLLAHHNAAVQADIRHATLLPRTTLARILDSLEKKKVVTIEKLGKAVKIRLSDWILKEG